MSLNDFLKQKYEKTKKDAKNKKKDFKELCRSALDEIKEHSPEKYEELNKIFRNRIEKLQHQKQLVQGFYAQCVKELKSLQMNNPEYLEKMQEAKSKVYEKMKSEANSAKTKVDEAKKSAKKEVKNTKKKIEKKIETAKKTTKKAKKKITEKVTKAKDAVKETKKKAKQIKKKITKKKSKKKTK